MAKWQDSPSWTSFENINNGEKFNKRLSAEDFNALAENIAFLYNNRGQWKGEYVNDSSYRIGDIVSYNGYIYLCIKDADGTHLPTNTQYWEMLGEGGGGGGGGNLYGIEITPTKETQTITPEGEYDGFDEVIVKPIPDEYVIPNLQEKTAIANGEITADEGYTGLSKVTVNVSKEKYDGRVVISAARLSGTWLIDSEALYNLLLNDRDNVAQNINFSAGVKGSDAGVIYYTSMTFNFGTKALSYSGDDGTNSFSNYNYSAYGDGWREYPDGDNGATINFDEEQAVSADFYQAFTSIATKEV